MTAIIDVITFYSLDFMQSFAEFLLNDPVVFFFVVLFFVCAGFSLFRKMVG